MRTPTQVVSRQRDQDRADTGVIKDVGEEANETQECPCYETAQDPDTYCQQRYRDYSCGSREIAEIFRNVL